MGTAWPMPSRRLPPLLLATGAIATLTACGSGQASFTAKGDHAPAGGPPITMSLAQRAIEAHGVDLFQNEVEQGQSSLSPRPVDSGGFRTADSGYLYLYVFVDPRTARAALPSARSNDPDGRVVRAGNVIAAIPRGRTSGMTLNAQRTLQQLAAQGVQAPPASPGGGQSNLGGAGQQQGPPT